MKTNLIRFALVAAICSSVGCAMCCGPFDYDYPVYGGKHQRNDQTYGRVGSVFSDPMASVGESADSNIKPLDKKKRKAEEENDREGSEEAEKIKKGLDRELDKKNEDLEDLKKDTKPDTKENNTAWGRPRNRIGNADWR